MKVLMLAAIIETWKKKDFRAFCTFGKKRTFVPPSVSEGFSPRKVKYQCHNDVYETICTHHTLCMHECTITRTTHTMTHVICTSDPYTHTTHAMCTSALSRARHTPWHMSRDECTLHARHTHMTHASVLYGVWRNAGGTPPIWKSWGGGTPKKFFARFARDLG